jgi:hypothetical protein
MPKIYAPSMHADVQVDAGMNPVATSSAPAVACLPADVKLSGVKNLTPADAPPAVRLPADLEKVVASWSTLPEHIRAAVLALIGVAGAPRRRAKDAI